VSVAVNGRGVAMLKAGTKRRRTKAELDDFKLEEEMKVEEEKRQRQRITQLEQQVVLERQRVIEHQQSTNILTQFHEQGLIAQDPAGQWQITVP